MSSPGSGLGSGSGLGDRVPRVRIELNSQVILIRWNLEDWKKVENLFIKRGLKKRERTELFRTPQSSPRQVYIYSTTPYAKRYFENDIEIQIIDDIDSRQIIDFERYNRIIINRGIFRVVPDSNGFAVIEYTSENIFIPEIKQNYQRVLKAVKTALQDLLNELVKIRYKLVMEVY